MTAKPPAELGHVDPTAIIESGAIVHATASVWQYTKVRAGAVIGSGSRIGGGVYIGLSVRIGANCKIENGAQVFEGSEVADGVFIGPAAILANDRHPRATMPDGTLKDPSDWTIDGVTIEEGASLGAGAIVLPGLTIGPWAVVGAGAVVTRDVDAHQLVIGSPARPGGRVCRCARRFKSGARCPDCGYLWPVESTVPSADPG